MDHKCKTVLLNQLIQSIYTIQDYNDMRQNLVDSINSLVRCKLAKFYLFGVDHSVYPPVSNIFPPELLAQIEDDFMADDSTSWFYKNGQSIVYREKDFFDQKTLQNCLFYKEICIPYHLDDSLITCLACEKSAIGLLTLMRDKDDENFSQEDIFYMELLKDHLESRHIMEMRRVTTDDKKALKNALTHDAAPQESVNSVAFVEKYQLTLREHQILKLIIQGKPNQYICDNLCISNNTVKKHLTNIYHKLGISRRSELLGFKA